MRNIVTCPKNEQIWVSYYVKEDLRYIITSKKTNRDLYYAYEIRDGKSKKIARSKSPIELEKYFKE